VSALKLFYEKIPRKKLVLKQIERPKHGRFLPQIMTREDVAKIINATNNLKHRAMLSLIYSCGLRRSELLDMKIADIDSKRNLIIVRRAKGDKDRVVPLSPKILDLLREYFKQYRPITWLFEGQYPNTPYTGTSLHHVFVGAMKKAGVKGDYSLHTLRHCFATHLLEDGINLRYIQELLGHRYLKTTEIYLHVSTKDIQKIKSPFDSLEL
jgi:integrase/recombinase XerD